MRSLSLLILLFSHWTVADLLASDQTRTDLSKGNENLVSFSIRFKDEVSSHKVLAVSVLPQEKLNLTISCRFPRSTFEVRAEAGTVKHLSGGKWSWAAPAVSGGYPLEIVRTDSNETMTVNAFVLVPFSQLENGWLNKYRVGIYPKTALKGLPVYERPVGFIEVTAENGVTQVSPHFTLGQFLCKQDGTFPKYLVLNERLVLKLESLIEQMEAVGISGKNVSIMSGYRTPHYNQAIKNVEYSMHVYGSAADIFVDNDHDGEMDDLNHDGKVDYRDAEVLYNLFDRLYGQPWYERFIGGLGKYRRNQSHGPFVHIDVRGFRARWG